METGYSGDEDDDESEDEESSSFTNPAKHPAQMIFATEEPPSSEVRFDMKAALAEPIRWKSPNGTQQTAVRIPRDYGRDQSILAGA